MSEHRSPRRPQCAGRTHLDSQPERSCKAPKLRARCGASASCPPTLLLRTTTSTPLVPPTTDGPLRAEGQCPDARANTNAGLDARDPERPPPRQLRLRRRFNLAERQHAPSAAWPPRRTKTRGLDSFAPSEETATSSRGESRCQQYLEGVGIRRLLREIRPRRGAPPRGRAGARHFRESEGLSIAQIAERPGRSPATSGLLL